MARTSGRPSLRSDVSTEGIHALFIPDPAEKLYMDTEDIILLQGKMLGVAKDIIDAAGKK